MLFRNHQPLIFNSRKVPFLVAIPFVPVPETVVHSATTAMKPTANTSWWYANTSQLPLLLLLLLLLIITGISNVNSSPILKDSSINSSADSSGTPTAKLLKLVVFSFDGFRHDYVTATDTPNLYALAQDGVRGNPVCFI